MDYDIIVVCRERLIAESIADAIKSVPECKNIGFSTNLDIDSKDGYCGCFLVEYEVIEPSFESINRLKVTFPCSRIVVLGDPTLSYALMEKGITTVIELSISIEELKVRLVKVLRGNPISRVVYSNQNIRREAESLSRFDLLSEQEAKILDFLVEGLRPGQVAEKLDIRPQSVSSAIKRMCDKVLVKDRMELCFMRIREMR